MYSGDDVVCGENNGGFEMVEERVETWLVDWELLHWYGSAQHSTQCPNARLRCVQAPPRRTRGSAVRCPLWDVCLRDRLLLRLCTCCSAPLLDTSERTQSTPTDAGAGSGTGPESGRERERESRHISST